MSTAEVNWDDLDIINQAELEEEEAAANVFTEATEDEFANQNQEDAKPDKVKRTVKPQPKFNAERLRGPRGIIVLEDTFKKVKFKGPKHEEQDLNLLMRTYEYWCHRLFPKFTLDKSLERLEKLGSSKIVKSYINRIRRNEVLDEAPVVDSDDDVDNNIDTDEGATLPIYGRNDNLFDAVSSTSLYPTHSNNADAVELTEEQLNRIRLNREKALQRKKQNEIRTMQFFQQQSGYSDKDKEEMIIDAHPNSTESVRNNFTNLNSNAQTSSQGVDNRTGSNYEKGIDERLSQVSNSSN